MSSATAQAATVTADGTPAPVASDSIAGWPAAPAVTSETAVLIDADTGAVLYDKGMDEYRYPASTTKIMTLLVAIENSSPKDIVTFTETGIRDLTEEQTERTDINCIPVICMGYYGGWSHDPEELAQQQQKILDTFPNKEKFIIVGTRPMDGSVDAATLDAALKAKWGKNYISAAEVTTSPSSTYEAQAEIAQAVLDKLEELKYIQKEG